MSRPTLDGCWAKLNRADEQLNLLGAELKEYVEASSHAISPKPEQGPDDWLITRFAKLEPPGPRVGVIVGEIVHDIRSALDQLVWQLVRVNRASTGPPDRYNQFPITCRPIRPKPPIKGDIHRYWDIDAPGSLKGVSSAHFAEIKRLQPHRRGSRAHSDKLWVLSELWNTDKHRVVHAAAMSVPKEISAAVSLDCQGFPDISLEIEFKTGTVKTGAEASRHRQFMSPLFGAPDQMQVHINAPMTVRFGKRRVGVRQLRDIGLHVVEILDRFAVDFPKPKKPLPRPVFQLDTNPRLGRGPTQQRVEADPAMTPAVFGPWRVWFRSRPLGTEPAWWFLGPNGELDRLGVSGLDEPKFVAELTQLGIPASPVIGHFRAGLHNIQGGWMFCPSPAP